MLSKQREALSMMKFCSKCGKFHDINFKCGKRDYIRHNDNIAKFRKTAAWKNKSIEIRERDKYLCQVCLNNLYETQTAYNYNNVSVHHIVKLADDFSKRLDNDYLITLCEMHHKLADDGKIQANELIDILKKLPPTSN